MLGKGLSKSTLHGLDRCALWTGLAEAGVERNAVHSIKLLSQRPGRAGVGVILHIVGKPSRNWDRSSAKEIFTRLVCAQRWGTRYIVFRCWAMSVVPWQAQHELSKFLKHVCVVCKGIGVLGNGVHGRRDSKLVLCTVERTWHENTPKWYFWGKSLMTQNSMVCMVLDIICQNDSDILWHHLKPQVCFPAKSSFALESLWRLKVIDFRKIVEDGVEEATVAQLGSPAESARWALKLLNVFSSSSVAKRFWCAGNRGDKGNSMSPWKRMKTLGKMGVWSKEMDLKFTVYDLWTHE